MSWNRADVFQYRSVPFHIRGVGKMPGAGVRDSRPAPTGTPIDRAQERPRGCQLRIRSNPCFIPRSKSSLFCRVRLFDNGKGFAKPAPPAPGGRLQALTPMCPMGHVRGKSPEIVSMHAHAFLANRYCATWP